MRKIIIIIIIVFLNGCTIYNQEGELFEYKIIIFIDKTTSINETAVPHVNPSEFNLLVDQLNKYGGELVINEIKPNSQMNPKKYSFKRTTLPHKKHGQSFVDYASEMKEKYGNPQENLYINEETKVQFISDMQILCDYSRLYPATDINGAIEFAIKYLNEPIPASNQNELIKAAIFISDGQDTRNKKIGNYIELLEDINFIIIRKSLIPSVFSPLEPMEFTDLDTAIEYLIRLSNHGK